MPPKTNFGGDRHSGRSRGFESGGYDEMDEPFIEDGSMTMTYDFPLYGNDPMTATDSNDLHIYVNSKSDDDSSYFDKDFDNNSLIADDKEDEKQPSTVCVKIFVVVWIIAFVLCLIYRREIGKYIKMFSDMIAKVGPISFLYYILALSGCFPVLLPIELMILSAGFVYSNIYGKLKGIIFASLTSLAGYLIGSSICYMISKYWLYNGVKHLFRTNKYYKSINRTDDKASLRVVAMLRISPLLPHAIISYMIGTTDISYVCFSIGNLASYPGILALSYMGSLLDYLMTDTPLYMNIEGNILFIVGILLSIVGIIYAYKVVKNNIEV